MPEIGVEILLAGLYFVGGGDADGALPTGSTSDPSPLVVAKSITRMRQLSSWRPTNRRTCRAGIGYVFIED
jgi:hypothetical protein